MNSSPSLIRRLLGLSFWFDNTNEPVTGPNYTETQLAYWDFLRVKAHRLLRRSVANHIFAPASRGGESSHMILMKIKASVDSQRSVGAQRPLDLWRNAYNLLTEGIKPGTPIKDYVISFQEKLHQLSDQDVNLPKGIILAHLVHVTNRPECIVWRHSGLTSGYISPP
ncbi:uncharacterized protein BKCO1_7000013 [Diplodia corticola]|uniref:Uncharacterized protein n=1 Tax=Diplodia corticola TaxID=236234 RepID=A0A1J9QLV7_9PEZI|nr:uncharacterized protein BKCO1_7000013 [Diplodia corticola]OJD29886.1 hypothetical protein BKCO1_7000013 [Diplodia corticola]